MESTDKESPTMSTLARTNDVAPQQPGARAATQGNEISGVARAVPAIGRLLLAALFLLSGMGKLLDPSGTIQYIASAHLPAPLLAYVVAVVVEVFGGIFLVIGYWTRTAAVALGFYTLLGAMLFHANWADLNQMIHFMKNIAIIGGLLQVTAFGAGPFSVDNRKSQVRAAGRL
jgi:putative oxidoreductase